MTSVHGVRARQWNGSLSPMSGADEEPKYWTPRRAWRFAFMLYVYFVLLAACAVEAVALGSFGAFSALYPGIIVGIGGGVAASLSDQHSATSWPAVIGVELLMGAVVGGFVAYRADASWSQGIAASVLVAVAMPALTYAALPLFRRGYRTSVARHQNSA